MINFEIENLGKNHQIFASILVAFMLLVCAGAQPAHATLSITQGSWGTAGTGVWGTNPSGGIYLGAADNANAADIIGGGQATASPLGYAAFTLGGSGSTGTGTSVNIGGTGSTLIGDLGVAGNYSNATSYNTISYNSGYGSASQITVSTPASIAGTLYYDYNVPIASQTGSISGGTKNLTNGSGPSNTLAQGVYDALSAANFATNAAASTTGFSSIAGNTGYSYTQGGSVSLSAGQTAGISLTGNQTVLKLTNFTLNGGTFTLQGTATTKLVIDVSSSFNILSGAIALSGTGMTWNNVLWNIGGTNNITIGKSGSSPGSAVLYGYLLAAKNNQVTVTTGGFVHGEVIAGGSQFIVSGGGVISK